jgi:AcrR family transcriptional regulator
MAPEERREKILDAAVELILAAGHAGCSLEEVAQAAHISTPLIYKYFPKREELLKALLEREFEELRGRGLDSVPRDVPAERVIRSTVERALTYYFERGPIVRLLSGEPSLVAQARAGNRASRVNTTDFFIRKFMDSYGVPKDVARIAVTMVVNAPILSIPSLKRRDISAERTIAVWSTFIIGGWKALETGFGTARKKPQKSTRAPRAELRARR